MAKDLIDSAWPQEEKKSDKPKAKAKPKTQKVYLGQSSVDEAIGKANGNWQKDHESHPKFSKFKKGSL